MLDRFFNPGRALAKRSVAKTKARLEAERRRIREVARKMRAELNLPPDPRLEA
jgi:hypothetical protein